MVNNENIIIERGKALKKINIFAIALSLIFLVLRILVNINDLSLYYIPYFGIEICTLFTSLLIILIGEIKYKNKEGAENIIFNKYNYYNKKGIVLLVFIIIGYCMALMPSRLVIHADLKVDQVIKTYEILGLLSLYYFLKKKDININYTFLENNNKTYYTHVLKNILVLAIIVNVIYLLFGIVSGIIFETFYVVLKFILSGILKTILLGGMYLLFSWLEKIDYDKKEQLIKKPLLISSIIYCSLSAFPKILFFILQILPTSLVRLEIFEFLPSLSEVNYIFVFYSYIFYVLMFTFLLSYLKNSNKIKICISMICLLFGISFIVSLLQNSLINLFFNSILENIPFQRLLQVLGYVQTLISMSQVILFLLIIIFLIKDYKYPKNILVFPIIMISFSFIETLFLSDKIVLSYVFTLIYLVFYLLSFLMIYNKQHQCKKDLVTE